MAKRSNPYTPAYQKKAPKSSEKALKRSKQIPTVEPKNDAQRDYMTAMRNSTIVMGIGSAGTGKTYLAAQHAVREFAMGHIKKIVLVRPAVAAGGEKLGFLPGTTREKMAPYIQSILDVFKLHYSAQSIEDMIEKETIEIIPLGFMRGRSLDNCIILCDEAQNMTPDQMIMLMTRVGQDSKLFITGDLSQRDISGVTGVEAAEERVSHLPMVEMIKFGNEHSVRSPIVKQMLEAWGLDIGAAL